MATFSTKKLSESSSYVATMNKIVLTFYRIIAAAVLKFLFVIIKFFNYFNPCSSLKIDCTTSKQGHLKLTTHVLMCENLYFFILLG